MNKVHSNLSNNADALNADPNKTASSGYLDEHEYAVVCSIVKSHIRKPSTTREIKLTLPKEYHSILGNCLETLISTKEIRAKGLLRVIYTK